MKTLFSICVLLLSLAANGQSLKLPLYVDVPIVSKSSALIPITTDSIDPLMGLRLIRFVSGPAHFTLTNFVNDAYTTLYYVNPNGLSLNFPTNIVWLNGPAPTNQVRGAILLESINGEIWATQ